jgi:hypothetical protein
VGSVFEKEASVICSNNVNKSVNNRKKLQKSVKDCFSEPNKSNKNAKQTSPIKVVINFLNQIPKQHHQFFIFNCF